MTAPSFNFPNLTPPQAVPSRSRLDGFAELLASIQDRRAQRDIARQSLALDKRRVEQSETMDKFQVEETKRKHDVEERRLRANDAVDRYVAEALQDPHLSPTKISDIRSRMVKENDKDLSPYLNEAFDTELQAQQNTLKSVADRQAAEAQAEVATKTKGNAIEKSSVDLDNAKLERTIRELTTKGFDVQRLSGAHDYARASGLPWGVVRKQFGLPHIAGGIADTFTFPDAKAGASAQGEQSAQQLRLANDGINALGNVGLSAASYASLSAGSWTAAAINGLSSKEQQQAAAAYSQFIAPIQAVLVKGAASDKDVQRMQRAYVTLDSDATEVRAQKALVRTALAESFNPAATDYEGMLNKFEAIIKEYKIPRTSPVVAPFLAMRPKLKALDRAKATPGSDDPVIQRLLNQATTKPMPPR